MDWGTVIASGVAGLAAGAVGSLVAPWVQLAVEQRRAQGQRRRDLVDSWREMVSRHHRRVSEGQVVDDPAFLTLRPLLTENVRRRLETQSGTEAKPIEIRQGATGLAANADLELVAQEIDRIEGEWKLR